MTVTIIWTFIRAYWKPIALVVGLLALLAWHKVQVNNAWHAGQEALKIEQKREAERRDADAKTADDAVRKCADDPACLMRDDGHRRD